MGKFLVVFFGGIGIGFCAAVGSGNLFVGIGVMMAVWVVGVIT